ncbi:MAG: DUF2905 domain-containing protein [Pseudomonadota bacterium]
MQKTLVVLGILIVLTGLAWPWLSKLPFGRLPGDFVIRGENSTVYFPLATMIVVSLVLSLIVRLFR